MFILNGKKICKIYSSCFYCGCFPKTKTFYIITLDKIYGYIAKICDNCFDKKEYNRHVSELHLLTGDEINEVQILFAQDAFKEMLETFDAGDLEPLKDILEKIINERCIKEIIE
jgi:hypothetical protein